MRDPMRPHTVSVEKFKKKSRDVTIPLAVLEAVRGEIQYERAAIDEREPDAEETEMNERVEEARQTNFEKDMHYQEAADVLFSHADYDVPSREDLLEWLGETKGFIRKMAKEEEEKYRDAEEGGGIGRIFRSRLLTDVPAMERYQAGQQTTGDYREIMGVVEDRLLSYRERVGTLLLEYANNPKKELVSEMHAQLKEARKLELFLSQLEGERNERIAKKQP